MEHPALLLASLGLLVGSIDALRVAGLARVALETGGVITVVRNASEQPFRAQAAAADGSSVAALPPLCVIVRTAGEGYSLRKPGYALGLKGPGSGPFMKSYRFAGENLNASLTVLNDSAVQCSLPSVWTAGITEIFVTLDGTGRDAGNWTSASFEYYALLNPAWGRRPYIRETNASLVVATDRSLFGLALQLVAKITPTFTLNATIPGGREQLVPFSLAHLPVRLDAKVNITLTLPSGLVVAHMRRFLRVEPPGANYSVTTFQVDHERGGSILAAGVPYVATGWFAGGYTGEYAGFPLTIDTNLIKSTIDRAGGQASGGDTIWHRSAISDLDQTLSQISVATEWGRLGLNFVRSGVNNVNKTEGRAYLDAMAAMGQYALWQTPIDDVAMGTAFFNPETGRTQPASACPPISPNHPCRKVPLPVGGEPVFSNNCPCTGPNADPTQRCCMQKNDTETWAHLLDNLTFVATHQAYAGAYGCDDCCHTSLSEKAWVEYRNIANVKDVMMALDPYHFIFGTIACDDLWMWSETGAGLGLDVVMKENYGGSVSLQYWDAATDCESHGCRKDGSNGGSLQQGPHHGNGYASGIRSAHHRNFPMTWEPIWNMPDPGGFTSVHEMLAFAWRDVVISGETATNWFVYNNGMSKLSLLNTHIPLFQAKIQELLPSLHSRARFSQLQLPLAVVTATDHPPSTVSRDNPQGNAINGPAAAVLRLYTEEQAPGEYSSEWYCMHLIVISTLRQPQTLTYHLSALPPATHGQAISATAIFDDNYSVDLNVSASGEADFRDMIGSFGQRFYRFGCARPVVNASNLVVDPSFEGNEHQGGLGQGLSTSEYRGPWSASCHPTTVIDGSYPLCDPRLHTRWSTADPRTGRHSLLIQIPTRKSVAVLNFPHRPIGTTATASAPPVYRVSIWARSSPHRVNATLKVGWRSAAWSKAHPHNSLDPPNTVASTVPLSAGTWSELAVTFRNESRGALPITAQLWLSPQVGVAATVWIDDASIVET